jgi:hypothetical protein
MSLIFDEKEENFKTVSCDVSVIELDARHCNFICSEGALNQRGAQNTENACGRSRLLLDLIKLFNR